MSEGHVHGTTFYTRHQARSGSRRSAVSRWPTGENRPVEGERDPRGGRRAVPSVAVMENKHELLSSVQMARFVARGSLRLDAVVPAEMNTEGLTVLADGVPPVPYGTPLSEGVRGGLLRPPGCWTLPQVAGALRSLVGPEPTVDHHAVHVREPRGGDAQPLHGDAIIDVRPDAFDVQLMYYPQAVTLEMGGTLSVPGSHLRRINESDTGRYQNLRGQDRLVCPAGTVVFLHHGLWHGGRRNDSDMVRYMFKIRFNPTVRQQRLWDTSDLERPAGRDGTGRGVSLVRAGHGTSGAVQPHPAVAGTDRRRLLRHRLLGDQGLQPSAGRPRMTSRSTPPQQGSSAIDAPVLRQQVLVLYLANSALDSHVVGWSLYDGTGRTSPTTGDSDEPPYESGTAAPLDGWRHDPGSSADPALSGS